jgi:hypothetical protein
MGLRPHSRKTQRLLELARSQQIDAEVAPVWPLIIESIDHHWIGPENLDETIDVLDRRVGFGADAIDFDFDPPGGDTLVVTLVRDEFRGPAAKTVEELRRLRARFQGAPDVPHENDPAPTQGGGTQGGGTQGSSGASAMPDLAGFFAGLLGSPAISANSAAVKNRVAEVSAAISGLVAAMQSNDPAARQRAAADVEALQRSLAASGTDAARWTDTQKAEIARALQAAGGVDTDKLAQGLKTITAWLEQKTPEAGRAVDAMVESLEKAFGALVTPGKKVADAERDERIRADARASIAQRLREAGLKPSGDS